MCIKRYIYMLIVGILLASCSGTKFVSDGQYMLNKVEVKKDAGKKNERNDMKSIISQIGRLIFVDLPVEWGGAWARSIRCARYGAGRMQDTTKTGDYR